MNLLRKTLIRFHLTTASQQDVALAFRNKEVNTLRLLLKRGFFPERAAAAAHLGSLKARSAINDLLPLLWDDFQSVAEAARKSLQVFLPDPQIEKRLELARQYWANKEEQRLLKRETIWYDTEHSHYPGNPMIDRSRMKNLAKLKAQLQKPIRFW